jgi:hypothetical protein
VDSKGSQHSGDSGRACGSHWDGASVSDNSRFIAFTSSAALSSGDTNRLLTDVYLRDRKKGTTTLQSVTARGLVPTVSQEELLDLPCVPWSADPAISGNGRFLAFTSYGALTDDSKENPSSVLGLPFLKVYLRDVKTGKTKLVSKAWDGKQSLGNSGMKGVSISRDGRIVSFISDATDLVRGQSTECAPAVGNRPCRQAYAFDRRTGKTQLVSVSLDGKLSDNEVFGAEVSGNGRFVMFDSPASNLVKNDDNRCARLATLYGMNCPDVFVRDLRKRRTEVVSVGLGGRSANEASYRQAGSDGNVNRNYISSDGRYVLFNSSASDIVPAGSAGSFVRDRKTGVTERVSLNSNGEQITSTYESISENGRYVMQAIDSCFFMACLTDQHVIGGTAIYDRSTGQTDLVKLNHEGTKYINSTEDNYPTTAISATGRYFVWGTSATSYMKKDRNEDDADVFIRDVGIPRLGALPKNMNGYPRVLVPGEEAFSRTGILELTSRSSSSGGVSGRLVYRPERDDIYVRLDIVGGADASHVDTSPPTYGLGFTAAGIRYEVRGARSALAPVVLLRCGDVCTEVATLSGGYGTVGESIVTTIPLETLGLQHGGKIANPRILPGAAEDSYREHLARL